MKNKPPEKPIEEEKLRCFFCGKNGFWTVTKNAVRCSCGASMDVSPTTTVYDLIYKMNHEGITYTESL